MSEDRSPDADLIFALCPFGGNVFYYKTCENVQNRIGCEPSKLQKLVFEPFVYYIYNKIYSNQTRMAGKCI